jgi:hypothetical protein
MTNDKAGAAATEQAEQAMQRVLRAEREAGQAVADCEAQAAGLLEQAQQRADRIAARTDERITRMQMLAARRIDAQIRRLDQAERRAREEQARSYRIDETGLAECIEETAVCLSGGLPTGGDGHG